MMQAQILVPLDGSSRAEAILTPLIPLAHATESGLTLVQAISVDAGIDTSVGLPQPAEAIDAQQAWVQQNAAAYLTALAQRVARPGWPVQTAVLEGEPRDAIRDYVTQHPDVRLIAMTTHGRRGVDRW